VKSDAQEGSEMKGVGDVRGGGRIRMLLQKEPTEKSRGWGVTQVRGASNVLPP